ncbi:MAG: oligoendopeptidase F [Opitutaceae bacterium]|nr:oligoendopeptidase F [Opitutaceae bacterium]
MIIPVRFLSCCVGLASLTALSPALTGQAATRDRAQVPDEYKWNFGTIFPDWTAWEAAMKEMEAKMAEYAALKGTLSQGPEAVLKAHLLGDEIGMLSYKVYCYTSLQRDVDLRNQEIAARFQQVRALFAKFGTATAWFAPELLTIPEATMTEWIAATPALAPYRHSIMDSYRQQKHVLNEDGERLLSYASQLRQAPTAIFQELSTSDIQFPEVTLSTGRTVKLTPAGYQSLLNTERNQADRALAAASHYSAYTETKNTYAAIYNGVMQRGWFNAQARNYGSTLEAALDGNAIPVEVVQTLVEAVRAGTAPVQRYMKLRKELLGLDSYHLYDGFVPIYEVADKHPYDTARQTVLESVAPLGEDYQTKMSRFLGGGWVDVYESEGKRSGAYNMGVYGVGPFLLMNYNDTLDAVFTLAHEAGHAMHTVLANETQPFATAGYTIFVAEVASTTNERFLLDALLAKTSDPKERFVLLQHAIDNIVGTFYTQVMFANFELEAHRRVEQGQPVTAKVLDEIYGALLQDYYGEAVAADEFYRSTWTRIPHFYNSPYYVYQYATCFASSAQLYQAMTEGAEEARAAALERYLTLLKSGGNDYPMELLKRAGVDLTQRDTIQAVITQMDALVTQLEAEAAKITAAAAE